MAGRRKRPPPARRCIGCGDPVARWKRLCDGCFRLLPYDRRREIAARRQRDGVHMTIDLYRDAAAWLAEQRVKRVEG